MPSPKQAEAEYERQRRANQPLRKHYYNARWKALRDAQLQAHPLCQHCAEMQPARVTVATVGHHIVPHNGDATLFYDPNNLASVCEPCHDGPIQERERRCDYWRPRGS
jgi:5-methylcytosine-specific restriction endonuclease McrA